MSFRKTNKHLSVLFGAAVLCVILVFLIYLFAFPGGISESQEVWGQFGDYMGGVLNPVLALIALLALLKTIALQSSELSLSRKELRRSASALKRQNESLKQQNFEATFFKILQLHHVNVSAVSFTLSETLYGREAIGSGWEELKRRIAMRFFAEPREPHNPENLKVLCREFFQTRGRLFVPLFNGLIEELKLVNQRGGAESGLYFSIVFSQLDPAEILLFRYFIFSHEDDSLGLLFDRAGGFVAIVGFADAYSDHEYWMTNA